ncbi:MAG: hypothetical protein LUG94_05190 [Ruminococcus sp.]|nr:hypothetical protein [Ruminococcus sp.]
MSENNNRLDDISAPILEDTSYDPNEFKKKKSLSDISAPILEDTDYVAPNTKKSLDNVSAPVLEDTFVAPSQKKGSLDGISAPTLDAQDFTPPPKKTVSEPSKNLEQVSAPVLESEPEERKPYVSKYANADIERAKQEGLKKAHKVSTPELTEEEKKKSREAYKQLMRQKEEDMAKKGGKMVIILVILGVVATLGIHLFISTPTFTDESILNLVDKIKGFLWYYDALLIVASFLLLPKIEGFKTFGSLIFGLNTLATLGLGIFLFSQMESIGIVILYFIMSLVCSGFITFQLSSNENIGKYYSKTKQY